MFRSLTRIKGSLAVAGLCALLARGADAAPGAVPDAQHLKLNSAPHEPMEFYPSGANLRLSGDGDKLTVTDYHGTVMWSGPVSAAGLEVTRTAGAEQVRTTAGKVLWSQPSDFPPYGLALDEGADGQTRLTDASGKLLWTGPLETHTDTGRSRDIDADAPSFVADALGLAYHVEADKAWIVDGAGKTVWLGHTPRPALLRVKVRSEGGYYFFAQSVSSVPGDFLVRLSEYRTEAGSAVVRTANSQPLGTLPITFGRLTMQTEDPNPSAPLRVVAVSDITPFFEGDLAITFLDRAGQEVASETLKARLVHSRPRDGEEYDIIRYDRNYRMKSTGGGINGTFFRRVTAAP